MDKSKMKIKILKNGPYIVCGHVPLSEKLIVPKGRGYEWGEGRELPQAGEYALCRCGRTKTPPFCDGAHVEAGFKGEETARREPYEERCGVLHGPALDLMDDNRCAFARFCHGEHGSTWALIRASQDPEICAEAVQTASDCPAGRLTARLKNGELLDPALSPSIDIVQDPERNVSGGIYVKGNIPIESADGELYEPRSRVVLCRCGRSRNMPFCDATHVVIKFLT